MQNYTDESGQKWYLYSIHLNDHDETIELASIKEWSEYDFARIVQKRQRFLANARAEYDHARKDIPQRLVAEELEILPTEERNRILGVQFDNDRKLSALNWEYVNKIKPYQDYRKFLESEGFVELDTKFFII